MQTSSSDPGPIEIPLSKGFVAIIDAADFEMVSIHKWYAETPRGRDLVYAARNYSAAEGGKGVQYLHAYIAGYKLADHINGNGLDNRRVNLRRATHSQNAYNAPIRRHNSSGFKGVSYCKQTGRWQVRISADGKERHVGRYRSAEEAAHAYDKAARELHREYATLNFPTPGERPARKTGPKGSMTWI